MTWQSLYQYWFGIYKSSASYMEDRLKLWFYKDPNVDLYIKNEFSPLLEKFEKNELNSWKLTPQGYLTLIILLDQVPRNSFRNQKQSFAYDTYALRLALDGLGTLDHQLNPVEKLFFYLPFEHSENLEVQKISLKVFKELAEQTTDPNLNNFVFQNLEYAKRHYEIIERFGRFPHRNKILERPSTNEELQFLKGPNSSF